MENDPTVDQDTATVVRQITAEVKQGKPIKIIHNEVDVNLMNKLFSGKRFMSVTPRNVEPVHQAKKKKSELEEEKIDKTLMNMLFREEKKEAIVFTTSATTVPSALSQQQPTSPPVLHPAHIVPRNLARRVRAQDELSRLQKEALEAQITKDKIIAQYYKRKLELLEQRTEVEHEA